MKDKILEMRKVYTQALIGHAEKDDRVVILEADLMAAHGTKAFEDKFPERSFNVGVAEANMVGIASGLSLGGKIPFATTFACFASRRAYDQFFISSNYAQLNVKLVGTDPGITATYNGGTHMGFEDVSMMRAIPNLVVFEPSDPVSLVKLMGQSLTHNGCTYMRMPRKECEVVYDEKQDFELGKGVVVKDGTDVTIIAAGTVCVPESLKAAGLLEAEGLSVAVIDMHTIKPIDKALVLEYAKKTGIIITCENHNINGGLGSAVAEVLGEYQPTPIKRLGINEKFGEVGGLDYLMGVYRLKASQIAEDVKLFVDKNAKDK